MTRDTAYSNRLWANLIVEELVRSGVGLFVMAPGSRSTPLTTAVAAHPEARHRIHFDERGTAFFALGYARATGRPAAWITTSGTAVANGFPAVVEASVDEVPLLLLTADRPPELRATGANQTIDQVKIFGGYVRWQFDLPAPSPDVRPEVVLTTVDQAVYRTRRASAGPVHLNCMFREPFLPDKEQTYRRDVADLGAWTQNAQPYTRYAASEPSVEGGGRPCGLGGAARRRAGSSRGRTSAGVCRRRMRGCVPVGSCARLAAPAGRRLWLAAGRGGAPAYRSTLL